MDSSLTRLRRTTLWLVPLLAVLVFGICWRSGLPTAQCQCAALGVVCALWWIFQAIPLPATALIPFIALPAFGIVDHRQIARSYGDTLILLLMGGFLLSAAMERSGAHRRLAVGMVRAVGGGGGKRLVLGFMLASLILSMWISNTATTLMMVPIAMAALQSVISSELRSALLLGIAFASSIGGMATPVGTPPNVMFMAEYTKTTGESFGFLRWMSIGLPISLILLPLFWLWLTRRIVKTETLTLPKLGAITQPEIRVILVFACTAFAWVFREEPWGGWTQLIGAVDERGIAVVGDSTVALAGVLSMFLIPSGKGDADRLLDWETAKEIPWGVLLLFGGGMALAAGFSASELSETLANQLQGLGSLPTWLLIGCVCLFVNFLTEITSSVATTALLLPVLATTARALDVDPALLMVPGTISASCAFMLPVATAPNVIVFSSGYISPGRMAREGILLNLLSTLVITTTCYFALR